MDDSPQSSSLNKQAIDAALDSRWEEALKINKKIIKLDPQNVDALNRLAKAYLELGKCNLAKKYYSEVLKFDPYNPIAQKKLKIIKSFKPSQHGLFSQEPENGQSFIPCRSRLSPSLFLQEPGKTKVVSLLKIAEPQKLSQAYCGMEVGMAVKNKKITIVDAKGDYLGILPDDISHRLVRFFKGGNKYALFVKSVRVNSLSVIIKEIFRSKKFKNQPSFLEYSPATATTNILTSLNGPVVDEDSEETLEEQEL